MNKNTTNDCTQEQQSPRKLRRLKQPPKQKKRISSCSHSSSSEAEPSTKVRKSEDVNKPYFHPFTEKHNEYNATKDDSRALGATAIRNEQINTSLSTMIQQMLKKQNVQEEAKDVTMLKNCDSERNISESEIIILSDSSAYSEDTMSLSDDHGKQDHDEIVAEKPFDFANALVHQSSPDEDAFWLKNFRQLRLFKQLHGHTNVPYTSAGTGQWTGDQRLSYRQLMKNKPSTLTPMRVQLLNALGFDWTLTNCWDTQYDEFEKFKKEHGEKKRVPKKNLSLSSWVFRQRASFNQHEKRKKEKENGKKYNGFGLSIERILALEAIPGFKFTVYSNWNQMYEELCQYKKKHGHTLVSFEDGSLGSWVEAQYKRYKLRNAKNDLDKRKLSLLDKIGFFDHVRRTQSAAQDKGEISQTHFRKREAGALPELNLVKELTDIQAGKSVLPFELEEMREDLFLQNKLTTSTPSHAAKSNTVSFSSTTSVAQRANNSTMPAQENNNVVRIVSRDNQNQVAKNITKNVAAPPKYIQVQNTATASVASLPASIFPPQHQFHSSHKQQKQQHQQEQPQQGNVNVARVLPFQQSKDQFQKKNHNSSSSRTRIVDNEPWNEFVKNNPVEVMKFISSTKKSNTTRSRILKCMNNQLLTQTERTRKKLMESIVDNV